MTSSNILLHVNGNARVLAGPGTGKTEQLIRKVISLLEQGINPRTILVVTFTRAASNELLSRILENENLNEDNIPIIKNLHAYSLKILMSDAYRSKIDLPLRILDDWEEENLLIRNLMYLLNTTGRDGKKEIQDKLKYYEAGWNKLTFDHNNWIRNEDIDFDITLDSMKKVFGFTLRGELNYEFKKYLDSEPIALEELNLQYVLVDEYQDLNPCEHAIIKHLNNAGAQILCFGDDDQSIYSFRQAAPIGIIEFENVFMPCTDYQLNTCYRCNNNLLNYANELILKTSATRITKNINSIRSIDCYIKCFQFSDGDSELYGIKVIVKKLIEYYKLDYRDILMLVPSKHYGYRCAKVLKQENIPLEDWLTIKNPLTINNIRRLYAIHRLAIEPNDQVAKWTWLKLYKGLSDNTLNEITFYANSNRITFNNALSVILKNSNIISKRAFNCIRNAIVELEKYKEYLHNIENNVDKYIELIKANIGCNFSNEEFEFITNLLNDIDETQLLYKSIYNKLVNFRLEPELIPSENKIRIMTMHKAKGLSSKAVIIPFQEDEVILSRIDESDIAAIEEKRRLFYVSITRAKNFLFITHSRRRIGYDAYTSDGRLRNRSRSRFLNDMQIISENGEDFIRENR